MGGICKYNFNDFINTIKNHIGKEQAEKIDQNSQKLKSIFDTAASTDGGKDANLLETDQKSFMELVNSTLATFNNMFEKFNKGKIKTSVEFTLKRPPRETESSQRTSLETRKDNEARRIAEMLHRGAKAIPGKPGLYSHLGNNGGDNGWDDNWQIDAVTWNAWVDSNINNKEDAKAGKHHIKSFITCKKAVELLHRYSVD